MNNLRRILPPPNSLVYFEAAARLGSFTLAADELGVTQAAVSRQVRILEDHLGVGLFRRQHRSVLLTAEGRKFFQSVALGLQYIASSAAEIRASPTTASLTVASTVAVTAFWLRPRIAEFLSTRSELDIRLVASDGGVDFELDGIDLCIRYGDGRWPDARSQYLFEEEIFPVCSPSYLANRPKLEGAADLLQETLLHFDRQYPDWVNWQVWLKAKGVEPGAVAGGPKFNNYPIMIQAALEGQGIALGWGRLIRHLLENGSLVRPVAAALRSQRAYYLAIPANRPPRPEVRNLWDWLLAKATAE